MMFSAYDLLQSWNTLFELVKANMCKIENQKIHLISTQSIGAPLNIMVPEQFVPIM